ncbi:PemK-like protein [compost metagenome]
MQTIVVRYLETVINKITGGSSQVVLGTETYEDIRETLIAGMPRSKPGTAPHPVFLTKCFINDSNHLWRLESIKSTAATATRPAVFSVLIQRQDVSKEIFLNQTLKKDKSLKLQKLLGRQGKLVEVDYGFVQRSARTDASSKSNKRYMDTLLEAEMHKRRLAVVVKVISKNLVQVAPVTSRAIAVEDRSAFKLEQATLDKMPRYQNSGKESYVLCSMLECVSTQRILPPISYFGDGRDTGRSVKYPVALSVTESKLLRSALIHAVGASGYVPYNDLLQAQLKAQKLQEVVDQLNTELDIRNIALRQLVAVQKLAKRWATDMGLEYEDELEFQRNLDAENDVAVTVF